MKLTLTISHSKNSTTTNGSSPSMIPTSTMNGANILLTRETVEQAPNAILRITVGNNSEVIVKRVQKAADNPNLKNPKKPSYNIPASHHPVTELPKQAIVATTVNTIKLVFLPLSIMNIAATHARHSHAPMIPPTNEGLLR